MAPEQPQTANLDGLDAGLAVLECFGPSKLLSLGEISAALGLSKSRTFRILATLKQRGFVEQAARGEPYKLGQKVWLMAHGYMQASMLPQLARPFMEELSRTVRGTIVLRVFEGEEQVTLECIHSPEVLRTSFPVGARYPATYGSTGKALLAFSAQSRIDAALQGLSKRDAGRLEAELGLVRQQGYALNLEESVRGVRGMAAPVLSREGEVVASIGASFPALDLPQSRIPQVSKAVRATCAAVRKRCGYS